MNNEQEQPNVIQPESSPPPEPDTSVSIPVTTSQTPAPVTDSTPTPVAEPTPTVDTPPLAPAPKSKRGLKVVLISLVVLLVVGGAAAALVALNKPVKATPKAVKKDVSLIRIGMTDPMSALSYPEDVTFQGDAEVNQQVFEGLTKIEGQSKVVPALATSWSNPSKQHWVFKLRKDVYFHTGHQMTAKQVKASLEAVKDTAFAGNIDFAIANITTPDAYTVDIETPTPDALLASKLSTLYIYDTDATEANSFANGTGAYTLKPGTKLAVDKVALVAYDKYYEGRPTTRALEYTAYEDGDKLVADYKKGSLDLVNTRTTANRDAVSGGSQVATVKLYGTYNITLNTKRTGPLSQIAVRQAVAKAIDRQALADVRGGNPELLSQYIPQNIAGYDASITIPKGDPAAAKAELAKAGYPNGFSMTFMYFATNQKLAEEVKRQLALAGITVTLDPQSDGDVLGQKVKAGSIDAFYSSSSTSLFDGSDLLSYRQIPSFYTSQKIADEVTQANAIFDPSVRIKSLQQANRDMLSDLPAIPLYQTPSIYNVSRPNLVTSVDGVQGLTNVFFWQVYSK